MTTPSPLAAAGSRTIPYDYSFQIDLDGKPGRSHQRTLSISVEAAFTTVSIGYGFVAKRPSERSIRFLYALSDEGTGRAFQNEPVLSTAGLGDPDGERPFRRFAAPIVFEPLSTIRLDIIEASNATILDEGSLHITLHGYKTLTGRRR
ncbi:MAG: hypothetical protein ACKV22_40070 [Bryobacteraceae bacterium]